MEKEYKDELKIIKSLMTWDYDLNEEDNLENGRKYFQTLHTLVKSKNKEVLLSLLDLFTEDNEKFGGILEHLKSEISSNYTLEQILQAFYKKFDTLVKNDIEIAVEMSMWFFDSGMFDDFRKMFNAVKTDKSRIFLDEFLDWYPDLEDKVNILRKDMETWPKNK